MRQESVKEVFMFRGVAQPIDFPGKTEGYSGVRYLPCGDYEK
ncbi:hypothetical protein SE916_00575 [Pseudomonas sp. 5FOS]|nr:MULTISPECIES: hypothetical protein [unclassified Pseudomonas]